MAEKNMSEEKLKNAFRKVKEDIFLLSKDIYKIKGNFESFSQKSLEKGVNPVRFEKFVKAVENEIKSLKTSFSNFEKEREKDDNNIASLVYDFEKNQNLIVGRLGEFAEIIDSVKEKIDKIPDFEDIVNKKDFENFVERFDEKVWSLTNSMEINEGELKSLSADFDKFSKLFDELKKDFHKEKARKESKVSRIETEELESLAKQVGEKFDDISYDISEIKKKSKEDFQKFDLFLKDFNFLKGDFEKSKEISLKSSKKYDETNEKVDKLSKDLVDFKKGFDNLKQSSFNIGVEESNFEEFKDEIDAKVGQIDSIVQKNSDNIILFEDRFNSIESNLDKAKIETSASGFDEEKFQEFMGDFDAEVDSLNKSFEKFEISKKEIKDEVNVLKTDLDLLKTNFDKNKDIIDKNNEDLKTVSAKLDDYAELVNEKVEMERGALELELRDEIAKINDKVLSKSRVSGVDEKKFNNFVDTVQEDFKALNEKVEKIDKIDLIEKEIESLKSNTEKMQKMPSEDISKIKFSDDKLGEVVQILSEKTSMEISNLRLEFTDEIAKIYDKFFAELLDLKSDFQDAKTEIDKKTQKSSKKTTTKKSKKEEKQVNENFPVVEEIDKDTNTIIEEDEKKKKPGRLKKIAKWLFIDEEHEEGEDYELEDIKQQSAGKKEKVDKKN